MLKAYLKPAALSLILICAGIGAAELMSHLPFWALATTMLVGWFVFLTVILKSITDYWEERENEQG